MSADVASRFPGPPSSGISTLLLRPFPEHRIIQLQFFLLLKAEA